MLGGVIGDEVTGEIEALILVISFGPVVLFAGRSTIYIPKCGHGGAAEVFEASDDRVCRV